jgi:hypothetical protein
MFRHAKPWLWLLAMAALVACCGGDGSTQSAETPLPAEQVWFAPDFASADFLNLFTQPDRWPTARGRVTVFKFYSQTVRDNCAGEGICGANTLSALVNVQAFSLLAGWNIAIAIEAPAVTATRCNATASYSVTREAISNVEVNGAIVRLIAMDEPFLHGQDVQSGRSCNFTLQQSAAQVGQYISMLEDSLPDLQVGDIEPYPFFNEAQLEQWLAELQSRGVPLAFFHLDVDRVAVAGSGADVSADLARLKGFTMSRKISFGVIYTDLASATERDYFNNTMDWVSIVKAAMGTPQHQILQSWRCLPACDLPRNLPDNDIDIYSHTRLLVAAIP